MRSKLRYVAHNIRGTWVYWPHGVSKYKSFAISAHRKLSWLFRQNYNSSIELKIQRTLYCDGAPVRRINNTGIKGDSVCAGMGREQTNDARMKWEKNECVQIKQMAEEQKYINLRCEIIVTATKREINTLSRRASEQCKLHNNSNNNNNRCALRRTVDDPKDYSSRLCIV